MTCAGVKDAGALCRVKFSVRAASGASFLVDEKSIA